MLLGRFLLVILVIDQYCLLVSVVFDRYVLVLYDLCFVCVLSCAMCNKSKNDLVARRGTYNNLTFGAKKIFNITTFITYRYTSKACANNSRHVQRVFRLLIKRQEYDKMR